MALLAKCFRGYLYLEGVDADIEIKIWNQAG